MESGLQSRVEDHSNITMFNFIAYPIFKRKKEKKKNATQHHDTDSKHPVKTIKGKNSLSLFLILKEHNCLVTHSVMTKNEKNSRNIRGLQTEWRGKIVRSSHDHGLVL